MNDKVKTGGSAFPFSDILQGMTLRDYFAAKVMQGELASQHPETGEYNNLDALAVLSYRVADAMLEARK